jgi:hypothetical protein
MAKRSALSEWSYRGLGKTRTAECGCQVIAYPGGKIVYSGCGEHRSHNQYVCQVCSEELDSDKALHDHRWKHSV